MKKLAKLVINFSLHFILIFLAAVLLKYLGVWIDMARNIPLGAEPGVAAADLAWKSLPIVIYLSMLFALSYSVRRKIPAPAAIICTILLGCLFTAGSSILISRADSLKFAVKPFSALESRPGLILTQSDNAIILLKGSRETRGPRVVSIPGRPLIYQEEPRGPNNSIIGLPALPFGDNSPWFIRSMGLDFNMSAIEMEKRLDGGFLHFAVYAFSLVLFLGSLCFLFDLSKWPLANLFFGALIFRMVLLLETFLNSPEINSILTAFMAGKAPFATSTLITPLAFTVLGILILIYTLLAGIAKKGGYDED